MRLGLGGFVLAGAGGVLAWNFFFFVKDIVENPDVVLVKWQSAVTPPQKLFDEPEAPAIPPASSPEAPAASDPAAPPAVAPPTDPAAAQTPATALEDIPVAHTPPENDDTEQFLNFADSVLDRFEKGEFSWLAAMFFLVVFCWILGKIPGVMISLGSGLVTALLNHDKAKT